MEKVNRPLRFRAWDWNNKKMIYQPELFISDLSRLSILRQGAEFSLNDLFMGLNASYNLMQYTGLKDKNGLAELYEGDIIDINGKVVGNQYENPTLLKEKINYLIQGFGTSTWETTNKKAMERGCKYSE